MTGDKYLKEEKMAKKSENHKYSEKSKFPSCAEPLDAKAAKGDFVHLKDDGDKHNLRGTYIVLDSNEDLLTLVKMLHSLDKNESTKLSSKEIYVKQTDVYKSSLRSSTKSDKLVPNDSEVGVPTDDKVEAESKPARPIWKVFSQDDPSSNDDSDHDSTPNYASDTSVLDIQTDDVNDDDVNVSMMMMSM